MLLALTMLLAAQDVPAGIGDRTILDRPFNFVTCEFRLVPELHLIESDGRGPGAFGFDVQAIESEPSFPKSAFHVYGQAGDTDPAATYYRPNWQSFWVDPQTITIADPVVNDRRAVSATLLVDGRALALDPWVQPPRKADGSSNDVMAGTVKVDFKPAERDGVVPAIAAGNRLTVRLFDTEKKLIVEKNFDVSRLRLVPAAIAASGWKCK